ncbi:MAG: hypothetical protein KY468_07080 [Armatimonadetes bacterium]|nr:hypothetical protein [Armatimonadota bacterium]
MNQNFTPLALLLGGLLFAPLTATAQEVPLSQKIVVHSEMIHTVRAAAGGFTAAERVEKFRDIFPTVIEKVPLTPSNIYIRNMAGTPVIFAGRYKLMTVTRADAAVNNTTQERLAQHWLRRYRQVLPKARPDQNWGVKG